MIPVWYQQSCLGQRPVIIGGGSAGSLLTVQLPVMIPGTYTYQWNLLGVPVPLATNSTFVSVSGLITVTVTNTSLPGSPTFTSAGVTIL